MAFKETQLGQARENSTNAVSVYSPASGVRGIIKNISLCNTTASMVTFRIFLDNNGTTYDQSTARYYDAPLPGNSTLELIVWWPMADSTGNLAYQSGVANAITITVDGVEIS